MKIRTQPSSLGNATNVYLDGVFQGNVWQFTQEQFGIHPTNRWYFDRDGCDPEGYATQDDAITACALRNIVVIGPGATPGTVLVAEPMFPEVA